MSNCFNPANILLPNNGIDMEKWSVIACDQFTSQADYWDAVEKYVGDGITEDSAILLGIGHGNGARGRHGHVPLGVRNLLDRGRATLLLRHLGDVLDGGLVIDRGHDGALAIELLQSFERLDDGQRAGIAHGIDFNLGRHSKFLSKEPF